MTGKRWIIGGVLLIAAAILIVILGVVFSVSRFNMTQVVMPGTAEFEMASAGKLNLAYEPRTTVDGVLYASPEQPTITFHLESLDGDGEATFRPPLVAVNYSLMGRHGYYIGVAELESGRWKLTGVAAPGDDRSGVYAYGQMSVTSIVIPILIVSLVAAVLAPIGLGLLIVGIVLQVHSRRRARLTSPATPPG
ncbi:MAG: hypothetical protein VX527_05150 [Planctomycetota bacterium]|nr:hypothetical protein [Planctomycetota bacterium]